MLQNIPLELQSLPQWVVAGDNKLPLNPRTGQAADVTNPTTWGTFAEAVHTGYKHVGFVLSPNDPYTIIDLDQPLTDDQAKRHTKILDALASYTELSQSGNGLHIIVRGSIPAGVRRDKVEVYSSARYMICTGRVFKDLPITDQQNVITALYNEMSRPADMGNPMTEHAETVSDEDIYRMAERAANADKFVQLWQGDWKDGYESQSEADFALLSMLAFYTKSNEQVRRLFRLSALGQRKKATANDKYIDRAIGKIRANEPPQVDYAALSQDNGAVVPDNGTNELQGEDEAAAGERDDTAYTYPIGLVGEIADFVETSSIRPVKEIALATAIAFCAGVIGRSYNVSGAGLNQYLIVLAKTGSGKEGAARAIDTLVASVRQVVPSADHFIGPGTFASGQALVRVLDERPCFISVLGEIGLTLQQLCDVRAPANLVQLKKVLLDLYGKSGWSSVLRPSVYSDTNKNTKVIQAPNVTLLGESTPETFFNGLGLEHIQEGLIPRFTILEYTGKRPARNHNAFTPPSAALMDKVASLFTVALTTQQNNTVAPVQIDAPALKLLNAFDVFCTDTINETGNEVERQLWNRAHLKVLKLSALVAVGCNMHQPVITTECVQWAQAFVEKEAYNMIRRFKQGETGIGESRQESDVRNAVSDYLKMNGDTKRSYKVPEALLNKPIVPYHYLRRRTQALAAFKNDRRGANVALNTMLQAMVEAEILTEIPPREAVNLFGLTSRIFAKGPTFGR
jgi:hypothetical protein